jgi:hypothetical protein
MHCHPAGVADLLHLHMLGTSEASQHEFSMNLRDK